MHFVRLLNTDPKRSEAIVQQIERNTSHIRKLRLVDSWIEVRVDSGLADAEVIGLPKLRLRNVGLDLVLRHSESKTQQFRRVW